MIAVIFTGHIGGHPGEDDVGPGEANQADHFIEGFAVAEGFKGMENVLRSGVGAVQEPDILDCH